ncbi:MAG: DegT/DnrJ/EryC1/StrS family aminotransferase, partial [Solirubrobacterales bacterium]|nr:DegT/DnrJ/EryC1/StrS family aminotransferase [Solirubrobacterales bacterium]
QRHGGIVRFVALDLHHARIRAELIDAFCRLLGSSAYTLGLEVERFEREFAEYAEVSHCVGVASGTAALELMLRAYGIGPGDEVVVPAHTFIASALAVTHAGATPVLCDVDEGTGLIAPEAARAAVGHRTAAILAVHLYGQTCDMAAIEALAKPRSLLILEDAAQAHGARYRGRRAGSLGSAAAFSFYPSKNLGALGDGGAVCTDDDVLAARVRRLRNLGQRAKGEHAELGYNERLDGLQAALLRVKLPYLDEWNKARRLHAARYRELLPADAELLEVASDCECVYHLFPARFENRARVGQTLCAYGVESGIHYSPAVHGHRAWAGSSLRHGELPVAEAWAARELSLPMYAELRPDEIERVATAVHAAVSVPTKRSGERRC